MELCCSIQCSMESSLHWPAACVYQGTSHARLFKFKLPNLNKKFKAQFLIHIRHISSMHYHTWLPYWTSGYHVGQFHITPFIGHLQFRKQAGGKNGPGKNAFLIQWKLAILKEGNDPTLIKIWNLVNQRFFIK